MTSASNDVRNYFKLDRLLARSHVILRQLFKKRYLKSNDGNIWDDTSACGKIYLAAVRDNSKINLTEMQKTSIGKGKSNQWDLTTLAVLLVNEDWAKKLNKKEKRRLHQENKHVMQLKNIRNKLAHHATKSIADVEFNRLWTDLKSILVALGDVETELNQLKDDSIFESSTQSVNEENVKKALHLNSLGTQARKDGNLFEAISLFSQATTLTDVPDDDRAVFFSNLSSTRLALHEQGPSPSDIPEMDELADQRYRALQDAKQARNLRPTWWKGHLRVGKIYAAFDEHEKAINSFERALVLDSSNSEVQKALDESRLRHDQQWKQGNREANGYPRTIVEESRELQQRLDADLLRTPMGDDDIGEIDLSEADVAKGHRYAHGDGDVPQDYEQAAKYFAKAASQGNAEGMYQLALLSEHGLGTEKDHVKALQLYKQAAKQPRQRLTLKTIRNTGVAEAEHSLGVRYAQGVVVEKDVSAAIGWYQQAVKHGSAESAYNLALMHLNGTDVDRDVEEAKQLLQLSARRGNPNAMLTLAKVLLHNNNFGMAKMWYDQACEAGNVVAERNRNMFDETIAEQERFIYCSSSYVLQMIDEIKSIANSFQTRKTVSSLSTYSHLFDYNLLNEQADRGSKTARKLCDALEHYAQAFNTLTEAEILTEEQENLFVHELSQCFRNEHIVAQIPGEKIRQKMNAIIDRVLQRYRKGKDTTAKQLDEDARICYATLQMDSNELIPRFLNTCKQKYPKAVYFFQLSASVNGFLQRYEVSLSHANAGLKIDPDCCELL